MKITARTEYATLAIVDLAIRTASSHVQAKEIARSQNIPLKFLEQILSQLRNAGLVRSVRGASGGYLLARDPSSISLRNVVEAVEGELALVDGKVADESVLGIWAEIQEEFLKLLDGVSVQQLMNRRLRQSRILDFQI